MIPKHMQGAVWRRSSRSNNTGGDCVEVGHAGDSCAVRDSKDVTGPALAFSKVRLAEFVSAVKGGRFDG